MGTSEDEFAGVPRLTDVQTLPAPKVPTCRAIVQCLPHAVVLLDADFRVTLANPAAASLFRVPVKELQGLPIGALVPHDNLGQLLADGRGTTLIETSLSVRTRRGAGTTVKITAVPAGEHLVLLIEDISDRVLFERQLVESEKQAVLGLLACGILREVANPIAYVASNLVFLRSTLETLDAEELRQALDISLDRLERVRQLLGTQPRFPVRAAPRYEIADVHEVLRRCITLIASEAERRRITLTTSLAPSIATCEMDVRLIRQMLLNLLRNAMEAMPDGGRLEVRTRRRGDGAAEPAVILIQVADTGVGIADADLRRVFRPLFSTKPRCAGLGLSFCRQTVEEHGGQIRLASRGVNHGTVVTVSLPFQQIRQAEPAV